MEKQEVREYGIRYKKIKIQENAYIYVPINLVEGSLKKDIFISDEEYETFDSPNFSKEEYIVDGVYDRTELCKHLDYEISETDTIDFLKDYYLEEEKDNIIYLQKVKGRIIKNKININWFNDVHSKEIYERHKGKVTVALNKDALDALLNIDNVADIKESLLRYKRLLASFIDKEKKMSARKIIVEDGKVKEISVDAKVKGLPKSEVLDKSKDKNQASSNLSNNDISLRGLENYIKERVFGHDDEIRFIAKNILMNYTALNSEKTEPMLLIGPTGTGKTETMRAAQSYLDIPFIEVNSANLVPEGIKGASIEDYLFSLYAAAGYDMEKASKGIIFFDEFDKLGISSEDYKSSVLQILLKFLDGTDFLVDKQQVDAFNFNTSRLTQVYAGAFSELFDSKKSIGFISEEEHNFSPRNITEADYFGKELVSRIPHILVYNELSKEQQREVITRSKLSQYLLKKQRYKRQFNVEMLADDTYFEALIAKLKDSDRSMRDLNNLITSTLDEAECEMYDNIGKYKRLVLTRDTVENPKDFKLF